MFKWLTKKKTQRTYTQACKDAINDWIQCGTPQLLKQAHKLGLSVSTPLDQHIGNTVLHVAAQKCSLDSLFVLHGLHAKDAIPNKQGRLAIHIAAATGFRDGVQYLLRNMAANIDARDADGRTPLMLAIANNQVEVIKVLVARGADVVGARTTEGLYAIHFCRSADVVRYLTTTTAVRINMPAASGETLLHAASRRADVPVAAEAIALGANISAIDHSGNNALHIACHHGRVEMVPFLVKAGCSATDSNALGFTPVEQALVRQDCDAAYALYCAGALFTKRQLLLLSILLRHSSLLRAIHTELQEVGAIDAAGREEIGKVERASKAVLSGAQQNQPVGLNSLVVVPGAVPEPPLDPWSLEETLEKLHDPVPRPVGSEASAVLVSVFSRFLRHSMHDGDPAASTMVRTAAAPKRYSDSEAVKGDSAAAHAGGKLAPEAGAGRGRNAASSAEQALEVPAASAALTPSGRKSLERLLPHYLSGLQLERQAKKQAGQPSWLPAAGGSAAPGGRATAGSTGRPRAQPAAQPAAASAAPPGVEVLPQLGGCLPGGPPPARTSMRPSFMHRPSFAVNGFTRPVEGPPEDRSAVRRSTFWARGKTTPTQNNMLPPVRRSRTLDLGRRNNAQGASTARGYGVGSAVYGAPKPRSSHGRPHDDIIVARSSRELSPPRGEDLTKDGMMEFESMMARRVAMFGRPSVTQ